MCGILGTLPFIETPVFKNALDTIAHRGPDDYGIWHDESIVLGHRRLSILDLSPAGHQPMAYLQNRYQAIFNGEIYNFLEIRKELEQKGYRFISESDTEVILASFIEWGEDCLLRFNGMWALAIWDTVTKKLFLSRDRFGKKPLFYAKIGDRFVFASEMKAIYPFLPEVKASPDFDWMFKNIFQYESTEKCLIDGIKRFPAGHFGYYEHHQLTTVRYWNTLDHLITAPANYSLQVEEFRELFLDACKIRMRSDVPIGTALSGGLDSSATISSMAHIAKTSTDLRVSKDWQHAFVASFSGLALDETKYAKKVVDHLNIKATYVEINPLECWDKLEYYLYMVEDLYITSPIPMIMTYAAIKKNGVTVSIDGHGADELFSGYGDILEALWDCGFDFVKVREILKTHKENTNNGILGEESEIGIYLNFMARKVAKKLLGKDFLAKDSFHRQYNQLDNFSKKLYIIFNETILPTLLRNYDRYAMVSGVEIRMPFMDHRLVSYVHSLPFSSKINNGYTKSLIRDAVAPFMPHEIAYRKSKVGFNTPITDWMQGPLKTWFLDMIHSSDFNSSGFVKNREELKSRIIKITNGNNTSWDEGVKAWSDLTPFLWEKAVLKRNYNF